MLFLTNLIELRLKLEYNFGFKIQRKQYNIFPVFGSRFKENTTLKNGASFGGTVFGVRVIPRCRSAYWGRQGVGLHHSGPWGCSGRSWRSWRLSCIWRQGLTCSGFYLLSDHFTQGRPRRGRSRSGRNFSTGALKVAFVSISAMAEIFIPLIKM